MRVIYLFIFRKVEIHEGLIYSSVIQKHKWIYFNVPIGFSLKHFSCRFVGDVWLCNSAKQFILTP